MAEEEPVDEEEADDLNESTIASIVRSILLRHRRAKRSKDERDDHGHMDDKGD